MERRKTPLMGWASWNCFRTNISEETIKTQADLLVSTGLSGHGYRYVNIDDGFFGGRDADGNLLAHRERFPNGMKVVADYIHQRGLKAGIYSDAGDNTCGHYYDHEGDNGRGVGLYGHEERDLFTYLVEWGYDFIKIDWCGGLRLGLDEEEQYTKIGEIVERIRRQENKPLVYNICRWQFPGEWAVSVADSWRTGADIGPSFESVLHQLDMIKPLRRFCGPGHVNDLDMLQIGNGMTVEEDRTHFSMWCMMSTPLMIGCDLTGISQETLDILANDELIAVNQDSACLQAFVVKEFFADGELAGEIWVKNLGKDNSNEKAVAFLNRSQKELVMTAGLHELGLSLSPSAEDVKKQGENGEKAGINEIGGQGTGAVRIRNLADHKDMEFTGEFLFAVKPHACVVLRIAAPGALELQDKVPPVIREAEIGRITMEQARTMVREGAVLVDVRTQAEYLAGHEEGAINIPYTDIHGIAAGILLNKNDKIITCCRTGKRGYQAAKSLAYLGYQKLYYIG